MAVLQARSFLIGGEVVVTDGQGVASFALLRGRAREEQPFVRVFDLLELDGEDLRDQPLEFVAPRVRIRSPFRSQRRCCY